MFVWCDKMIYLSMVGVIYFCRYNLDFENFLKMPGWLLATYAGTRTNYIGVMVGS